MCPHPGLGQLGSSKGLLFVLPERNRKADYFSPSNSHFCYFSTRWCLKPRFATLLLLVRWSGTREGWRLMSVPTIDWRECKNELSLQDLPQGWGRSTVPSTVTSLRWDWNPWRLQVHTWVSGPQKDRPPMLLCYDSVYASLPPQAVILSCAARI